MIAIPSCNHVVWPITALATILPIIVADNVVLCPVTQEALCLYGFFMKTAITVVTPPVICNSFPLPVAHLTAVEPPRDRHRVASLHFRDCTAVVLPRLGGDGGATAGARR